MPKVQDQIGREKNKASLIQKSGPFNNIGFRSSLVSGFPEVFKSR